MAEPTVFLGRYELHRRLGRGGMAEVFLARDLQLDRPVAVKVLFPEFATDPAFVTRFRREAQAAANLNHPNIVGVFDWGQEQGTYFIVQEYVEGRSLADILRTDGPMPPDRAADIATDVAAALAFAHRGGMLHRDIKPGNVLVTPAGTVKVADWGIGRALDAAAEENLTQTGAVMGTATYFSPEQAQGLSLDLRSDLYALGVVLYEMLTGAAPFSGDSPVAIAYKHVQTPPRPPRSVNPSIPPELDAIVLQLLEKDPNQRYESGEDLRADLRRYREGFRVHAMQRAAPVVAVAAATTMVPATATTSATRVVSFDEPPNEYEPPRDRSWGFLVALILLLLVLAGLLFALSQVLSDDDDPSDVPLVDVPSVVNLPEQDARDLLEEAGFVVTLGEPEQVDDPEQVGIVLSQDPEGGIRAEEGSEVQITVGAQNLFEMPDLEGSTVDVARTQLQGLGFQGTIEQTDEENDEIPAGQVIRTEPPAGDEVAITSTITLFVSTGPPLVPVPNVATLTESDAVDRIEAEGLEPQVVQEASATVSEGRVIRTEPAAGTEVAPGSTVVIVVSSGIAVVPVPDVVGDDQSLAEQKLEAAGFEVVVEFFAVEEGSEDEGRVISQDPPDGTLAAAGSEVTIVVGQAPGDVGD